MQNNSITFKRSKSAGKRCRFEVILVCIFTMEHIIPTHLQPHEYTFSHGKNANEFGDNSNIYFLCGCRAGGLSVRTYLLSPPPSFSTLPMQI